MNLELNDVQTKALIRELSQIVQNDRYPLSPRIVALKEILGALFCVCVLFGAPPVRLSLPGYRKLPGDPKVSTSDAQRGSTGSLRSVPHCHLGVTVRGR